MHALRPLFSAFLQIIQRALNLEYAVVQHFLRLLLPLDLFLENFLVYPYAFSVETLCFLEQSLNHRERSLEINIQFQYAKNLIPFAHCNNILIFNSNASTIGLD